MVRIYYHIYVLDGVDNIVKEHLSLIKKNFNFPYIINFGINIVQENVCNTDLLSILTLDKALNSTIRDIRVGGNEFTTLNLIYKDKEIFGNNDYILYLHTKGITRKGSNLTSNIEDWRNFMNYYCIEKVKDVFNIFQKTEFNTYGVNLRSPSVEKSLLHYSGNFWWAKSLYLKSLDKSKYDVMNRSHAEIKFIQSGENWKPYCVKESGVNHYYNDYKKENYR